MKIKLKFNKCVILIILFFITGNLSAQIPNDSLKSKQSTTVKIVNDSLTTETEATKTKLLVKASLFLGYAGLTVLTYYRFDTPIMQESQEKEFKIRNKISSLVSPLGKGKYLWTLCGGTFIIGYLNKNKNIEKTAIIWAGSLITNDLITANIRSTFQRHRPNTGDPYNTFDGIKGPDLHRSFPSFHASNSFATATVFATLYKEYKAVPFITYGMATLIGLSRINDNAHWASDVLTGAAVGFLSAKGVIKLYQLADKKFLIIIPQIGQKVSSISITYRF